MKKRKISIIIVCLIIITSITLIYNHNKTKKTQTDSNIQKVQSKKIHLEPI
ncbi:internalin [Clostridium botulinum CFSAN002367]|nr:internalin [Clostridium botulinum CFSAN002367]EPS51527.1 internalin [Clostridium botulinum CFSAN002369]